MPGANRRAFSPFPRWPSRTKVCNQLCSVAAWRDTVLLGTVFWLVPTLVSVWQVQSYCLRPRMGLKELDRLAIPERTTRVWVGGDTAWMGADQLSLSDVFPLNAGGSASVHDMSRCTF